MADPGVPHVPPLQAGLLGGRMAPTLGLGKIGVPLDKSGGVVRETSFRNAMKHRLPTPGLQPSRRYLLLRQSSPDTHIYLYTYDTFVLT